MNTTIEQLKHMAARLRGDEQSTGYAFENEDEPWVPVLRMLNFESQIWRLFRAFDDARRAYAVRAAYRAQHEHELSRLAAQLDHDDLESLSDEQWAALDSRARRLRAHFTAAGAADRYQEAKAAAQRTEDRWLAAWESYTHLKAELARAQAIDTSMVGYDAAGELQARIRQYEAPQLG